MNPEDKKILQDHSHLIQQLQDDMQTFFKVVQRILPEIERTETVKRLDQERDEFKRKCPELFE